MAKRKVKKKVVKAKKLKSIPTNISPVKLTQQIQVVKFFFGMALETLPKGSLVKIDLQTGKVTPSIFEEVVTETVRSGPDQPKDWGKEEEQAEPEQQCFPEIHLRDEEAKDVIERAMTDIPDYENDIGEEVNEDEETEKEEL